MATNANIPEPGVWSLIAVAAAAGVILKLRQHRDRSRRDDDEPR